MPDFPCLRSPRPPPIHLGTAQQAVLRHEDRVKSGAFSPGGLRVASGARDYAVHIWDAQSGQERVCLRGHENEVNSVAFLPDSRRIASGANDDTVRIWDAPSREDLR